MSGRYSTYSLHLDPEFDGEELLEQLENSFSVAFRPDELRNVVTVGDIFDLLVKKLPHTTGSKCRSQMAYYRLRGALSVMSPDAVIGPSTKLDALLSGAPSRFSRLLELASALSLPTLALTGIGTAAMVIGFGAFIGFLAFAISGGGLLSLAGAVAAFFYMALIDKLDRRIWPRNLETLGDLAQAASARNFARLSVTGGRTTEREIWSAMVELLLEHSNELARDQIAPSTLLFNSNLKQLSVIP